MCSFLLNNFLPMLQYFSPPCPPSHPPENAMATSLFEPAGPICPSSPLHGTFHPEYIVRDIREGRHKLSSTQVALRSMPFRRRARQVAHCPLMPGLLLPVHIPPQNPSRTPERDIVQDRSQGPRTARGPVVIFATCQSPSA